MELPPVCGNTWDDFVINWCLGIEPSVPREKSILAMNRLHKYWPEYWEDLTAKGIRGTLVMIPAINLGLTIAACETLMGFDKVIHRVRQGETSALSELTFGATLVELGFEPELEPELHGKHLDTCIKMDIGKVYAEIIAPESSDAMKQVQAEAQRLAKSISTENVGFHIEVLLQTDINEATIQVVSEYIRTLVASDELQEIDGLALVIKKSISDDLNVGPTIENSVLSPILGAAHVSVHQGQRTAVAIIRLPITDERAQRLLSSELDHFSKDERNLLVMNVSRIPGGMKGWASLLQRCFQPSRNRRIGAVLLYQTDLVVNEEAIIQKWKVLRNPYAYIGIPKILLDQIEALNETRSLERLETVS